MHVQYEKNKNEKAVLNKIILQDYPGMFSWAGEINIFKHALVKNGFFASFSPRVTVEKIEKGDLDATFR